MKALFLVLHRKDRSPGQRYRHEQYISFLEENGIECVFSPLLSTSKEDVAFYGQKIFPKIYVGLKALWRRFRSVLDAKKYDVVYIYRDAFFFGTFFEKWLKRRSAKILYDFDDAIWLMDKNANQGIFNRLKNPQKTATICALADTVIVGNEYLKRYAVRFNSNVRIIPSTIDFARYNLKTPDSKGTVCIGWTGSFSTIKHFETIIPALTEIKKKYANQVYFKLIGDPKYHNEPLSIRGIPWNADREVEDLSEVDIGIMPLPENDWTRGKCGMKGLQYMALGIATIMSPVGVNKEIICDGENGFLASSLKEWIEKLSLLIEDEALRNQLGQAGFNTVKTHFSVEGNREKWLAAFLE
ncbi:MAG: glycosyltransferase family 4 protein [Bacteroidota bacterium]